MLRPVVSRVSEQMETVDFYYIDVDQSPELAERFGIFSIPTLVLLEAGAEKDRSTGYIPEEAVRQFASQ